MASLKLSRDESLVRNICCIGAGYVGGPTSSIIAWTHPNITINVVDVDKERILAWKSNSLPITEPGLLEIVQIARDGTDGRKPNLFFSTSIEQAIRFADTVFIAVDTPTTPTGALATNNVEAAVETIARVSTSNKIIVVKSTVPPGTSRKISAALKNLGRHCVRFDVLSNPEFLAGGTAVENLLNPDRVLIGAEQDESGLRAMEVLRQIYMSWIPVDRIKTMHIESAELTKLATNVLLAQRISSINALSIVCEDTGADIEEVSLAVGLDTRIGPKMLKASLGFGGSCLKKDVLALAHFSHTLDLSEIGNYWKSINSINEYRKSQFAEKIGRRLNNEWIGGKIAVLGLAFKNDTGDVRESPAIDLLATLMMHGTHVAAYDPYARKTDVIEAVSRTNGQSTIASSFEFCDSAYDACSGAYAVVIATDWDGFSNRGSVERASGAEQVHLLEDKDGIYEGKNTSSDSNEQPGFKLTPETQASLQLSFDSTRIDWAKIADIMKEPKLIFDGHNVIDGHKLVALGFQIEAVGKTALPKSLSDEL